MFSEKVNITKTMALHRLFKYHYKGEKRILNSRAKITNFPPNDLLVSHIYV